jgi:CheY-like chemotaxis protein
VKVLLVDPDLVRVPTLKQTLEVGGAEVTVASSGSFALTMLEWNRHDVVVSRASIEDMHGHELCAILKADPSTRDVRFVLVAGGDEVSPLETSAAGVDLVLPPAMMGSAVLPLIVRLVGADRATAQPAAAAPASTPAPAPAPASVPAAAPELPVALDPVPVEPVAAEPPEEPRPAEPPGVPRIRPEPPGPLEDEPPKRYVTAVTAAAAAPWSKTDADVVPTPPLVRPPALGVPPVARKMAPGPTPKRVTPGPTGPPLRSTASPARPATPPARPAPPRPAGGMPPSPAPMQLGDLMAIPSGTFQGSLEVMDLADLTQAIAGGGKSGRLILALSQGGGLMLFEKGRVVHAEYRTAVGEEAFGALLTASHADSAGRFCFLPAPAGESPRLPRTIDKSVDRLLLTIATAIDEKG